MSEPRNDSLSRLPAWLVQCEPELTERARQDFCLALLDTWGVSLLASTRSEYRAMLGASRAEHGGRRPVWWSSARLAARDAATANGFAAHLLDFDSVHYLT